MRYIRYGVEDLLLTEKESKQFDSKYVTMVDENGNRLGDLELYWVADEDEDGNELTRKDIE